MLSVKKILSFSIVFLFSAVLFSQVQIDQSIQLTGGTGLSSITGIVDPPVLGTDAVNKDYVDAAVAALGGGGIPWIHFQVFNAGGTFVVPNDVTLLKIQVYGAGGGGGSGNNGSNRPQGGGGGAGGFSEAIFEVNSSDSYTVVVGT